MKCAPVRIIAILLAMIAAAVISACAKADYTGSQTDSTGEAPHAPVTSFDTADSGPGYSGSDDNSVPNSVSDDKDTDSAGFIFTPGVWIASVDGIEDSYYYFYPETGSEGQGHTADLINGIGTAFNYESVSTDRAVFHFGAADQYDEAEIIVSDSEHLTLKFASRTCDLEYFTDRTDLVWYSNAELEQMAADYYAANNGGYFPGSAYSEITPDGMVRIRLYDSMEDHDVTSAWYLVSRISASGWNEVTGEHVDLSPYSPVI